MAFVVMVVSAEDEDTDPVDHQAEYRHHDRLGERDRHRLRLDRLAVPRR